MAAGIGGYAMFPPMVANNDGEEELLPLPWLPAGRQSPSMMVEGEAVDAQGEPLADGGVAGGVIDYRADVNGVRVNGHEEHVALLGGETPSPCEIATAPEPVIVARQRPGCSQPHRRR